MNFTKFFLGAAVFMMFVLFCIGSPAVAGTDGGDEIASKVICNVILFTQKLGLPIMTGVILGSSIMAIFGRLAWPAIAMLVTFTAIFFGAGKLVAKFATGISAGPGKEAAQYECKQG